MTPSKLPLTFSLENSWWKKCYLSVFALHLLTFQTESGVSRFEALLVDEFADNTEAAILEIHPHTAILLVYLVEMGQKREFPFSSLFHMEKSFADYRLLRLTFDKRYSTASF